ncbi:hypothetical protein KIW84_052463 [Lathyrus oleraceus]|uniref:Thioredoxin domain-containing protein n=1 Tax=Pisum sativum TaxID=3888 RepID=A0A9D4WQE2_PEA|nr:hypothetical protein KIW84_052463 [Pisum sativum]
MALKVTSVSTPFFQLGSTASVFSLSKPCSFSKHPLRFNLNTRRKYSHPTSFVIRAARIESKGVTLGFRAPQFQLPEPLTGKVWALEDFEAHPALLVMFICNHCPFVKYLKKDIVKLTKFYMKKGLAVVAISSNSAATHPQVIVTIFEMNHIPEYSYDETIE